MTRRFHADVRVGVLAAALAGAGGCTAGNTGLAGASAAADAGLTASVTGAADADLPAGDGGFDAASAPASTAPELRIGGAADDGSGFVDWSGGGARPPIITGPQGGQHVWLSVRTRNLVPQKVEIAARLVTPETCAAFAPGEVKLHVSLKADGPWLAYNGITAFVDHPCDVRDRPIRVKVTVTDATGATAHAEADIAPTWHGSCK